MRKLSAILVLVVAAAGSVAAAEKPATLLSGPYIIALTTDGATVCWQTVKDSPGAVRVKAEGAAVWKESKEAKPARFHAVKLSELAAGTVHQVEVLAGPGGAKLGELSFRTAPKEADAFTFFAYGDTRTHPEAHERVVKALVAESERLKQQTFLLHTGDFASGGSNEAETAKQFFHPAAPVLARLPLIPVRGNHESGSELYAKYFPAPERPAASGEADDLCFDYGSVRIVVLDQYTRPKSEPERMKWLAAKLAEAKDRWRIVSFHEPIYSSGSHGSNVGYRQKIEPILAAGRVHAVLAGHDHNYERTKPIGGITYLTVGGGGAPLRGKGFDAGADWSVKFEVTTHFVTLTVSPEKLSCKVFGPFGKDGAFEVFDSFEIPKDCAWPGAKPEPKPEQKPEPKPIEVPLKPAA